MNIMEDQIKKNSKTVLVTGGLGFIGGHFIDLLLENGFAVVNVDKITYASNPKLNDVFSGNYPEKYRFIKKDINDLEELPYADYIVHFAAESHVDNSIIDGMVFTRSNVFGTQNLLNLLAKTRGKNLMHEWPMNQPEFIHISTDEVFGDIETGFFKEDDRHNPSNPYAASKSAAEMLVVAYGRTYGIPYKITRSTNNYGPRQHPEKLVPHCITRGISGNKIRIHGAGNQKRNWIHVEDNCRAIFKVMLEGRPGEIYNISSPEEYSVNDIARMVLEKLGNRADTATVDHVQDRSGQDVRYALDSAKIKEKLGWSARSTFQDSVGDIIEYYKQNHGNPHNGPHEGNIVL